MGKMKLWVLTAILTCGLTLPACSSSHDTTKADTRADLTVLTKWQAGKTVTAEVVAAYGGLDKCFAAEPIPDDVWARMQGKTYKENPYIKRSDLRYLRVLHRNADDSICQGEMVCNKAIAEDLIDIFRKLYEAHYPIERMRLIDDYDADDERSMTDNNTSCFNFRTIAGSKKLSKHSLGLAIDINPLYNPCVKQSKNGGTIVQPASARRYANRKKRWPYKITKGDLCYRLFVEHGFKWGGEWRSLKDYQHFER